MNPGLCSVLYFSCTSRVCVYQEIRMLGGIQPPQTTMVRAHDPWTPCLAGFFISPPCNSLVCFVRSCSDLEEVVELLLLLLQVDEAPPPLSTSGHNLVVIANFSVKKFSSIQSCSFSFVGKFSHIQCSTFRVNKLLLWPLWFRCSEILTSGMMKWATF